ncbi:hypothetical protein B0H63DRAFT_407062 [Podospora didyma]|uniref:Multiple RNA-binding domain-containing protein 1 n=1 Tax=Podospora didyma TaxID=330526 RepID=A0AAE0U7E5_9PEZI|nr:hypothetical protein B0H63DRAFT_407062 [Podospora didyma]
MESSRVYVKNLPPSITEADFRKHFSAEGREVTDVKLFPHRRIGFVGYKSPEDAARAVKYFNRSFIRMSRIGVEIAKPIEDSTLRPVAMAPSSRDVSQAAVPKPAVAHATTPLAKDDPSAKKRKRCALDEADPKLQEFLEVMGHTSKRPRDQGDVGGGLPDVSVVPVGLEAGESDDEYETIPSLKSKQPAQPAAVHDTTAATPAAHAEASVALPVSQAPVEAAGEAEPVPTGATDDDWLRSRTNRLLDLVDPDDAAFSARGRPRAPDSAAVLTHQAPAAVTDQEGPRDQPAAVSRETNQRAAPTEDAATIIARTCRLFLRNLSYTVTEDGLREHFGTFGELEEVNLPLDPKGQSKGFAMVRFQDPSAALAAFQTDGTTFQGRIMHILPAAPKRDNQLDEFALSKLPLKKQQLLRKKAEAASSTFNWNSLFMSQDAVNNAISERLGVSKHELLDPTDASAAVKQAVAETTVIMEAKSYFAANGVNIEAFKSQTRGDTSILVKNIKATAIEELRTLFEEHGTVLGVLMPPSGTIAIVQFAQPAQCRTAFAKKAYSRFKDQVLFLEKGPKGLFVDNVAPPADRPAGIQKASVAELLERDDAEDQSETSSLFVRNLNFSTTSEGLNTVFKPLDGFVSAQVKTKTDPKKPGQILSMGFGFCAFKTKEQAQAALKVMDGHVLDGHKLIVKASHKGLDAAEERRKEDLAKKAANQGTKVVIKNLPFEASKKDVRALFSTYGKLVALRIPKKLNHSSRGFAFAEFSTPREALNALTSLKDTHLLGRRLVLDFASAEEIDPEEQIKAMEKKIRGQVNKVALQQLTGKGRTKKSPALFAPVPTSVDSPSSLRLINVLRDVNLAGMPEKRQPHGSSFPCMPSGSMPDPTACLTLAYRHREQCVVELSQIQELETDPGLLPVRLCQGPSSSRQALSESTGNIQHSHIPHHYDQLGLLTSRLPPSIPTPPILPTQSLGSVHGSQGFTRLQQRHQIQLHGRRRRNGINPIWLSQEFQAYRKRQTDKDDKSDQKWPDVLEDAFLDALLLIPQMGRMKYTMKQTQYGRNMLIGEYLWISYCQSLPPGIEPDPSMWRERKQVSSHIQVLKNFFQHHVCFHFFFPGRERKEDRNKDSVEKVSLKNNLVLIALSEGRLPEERPNYEYFAQILAMNDQIIVRPKRCWIFVSNPDVVVRDDGSGVFPETGDKLDKDEYPHLALNQEREKWPKEEQQIVKSTLLHEFTKEIHQIESSTVSELSREWEVTFPELHRRLEAAVATNAQCDIMHMHVVLELKEKRRFPTQSELNSWIEVNIEQPHLLSHRWRVHTHLMRPVELSGDMHDNAGSVYETKAMIATQYQHRPDCEGSRNGGRDPCDCISQRCRRDWVMVPFPADVWAATLSNCAEYPAHPFTGTDRRGKRGRGALKKENNDGADSNNNNRGRSGNNNQPTQMDLVPKIAMMQEIFSCPPEAPHDRNQQWTRRALILWSFETAHSVDNDNKLTTSKNGRTNWRFLTVIDPASAYHQQRALLSGQGSTDNYVESLSGASSLASSEVSAGGYHHHHHDVTRDAIMSPSPAYQQQLSANMSENFAAVWDPMSSQAAYGAHIMAQSTQGTSADGGGPATEFGMLDSFGGQVGLATPPPSASLTSSFAHSFDGATGTGADHLANYMAAHAAATTTDMCTSSGLISLVAVTDPFLSDPNSSAYDMSPGYEEGGKHGMPSWGTSSDVMGIDPATWSNGYVTAASAAHSGNSSSSGGVLNWPPPLPSSNNSNNGLKSASASDDDSSSIHDQQWSAAAGGINLDETSDLWTPAATTSASTPAPTALDAPPPSQQQQVWKSSGSPGGSVQYDATSQEWVHVQQQQGSATNTTSDLSQDWEEVIPLVVHHVVDHPAEHPPPPQPLHPPPPVPQQQQQRQQQQQSRKRSRSDSMDETFENLPLPKHRTHSVPSPLSSSPPPHHLLHQQRRRRQSHQQYSSSSSAAGHHHHPHHQRSVGNIAGRINNNNNNNNNNAVMTGVVGSGGNNNNGSVNNSNNGSMGPPSPPFSFGVVGGEGTAGGGESVF